jgi:hypothetical protein
MTNAATTSTPPTFVRQGAPARRTKPYTAADVRQMGKLELHHLVDHLPEHTTDLGVVRAVHAQTHRDPRVAQLWKHLPARKALYRAALERHADNRGLPAAVRRLRLA